MSVLINNLWKIIISNMDCDSLRAMSCVDKNFNKLCKPKEIWKKNVKSEENEKIIKLLEYSEKHLENPWKLFHISKVVAPTKDLDGPEKFAMIKKVEKIKKIKDIVVKGTLTPYTSEGTYTMWSLTKDVNGEYVIILKDGEDIKKYDSDSDDDSDEEESKFIIKEYCGYFEPSTKSPLKGFLMNTFSTYEGEFKNGYFNGQGTFTFEMGIYKSDNWENSDCKNGVLMWYQGGYYEGEFSRMGMSGMGKYVGDTNYSLSGFRGSEGTLSGLVTIEDPSGHSFKANFKNGEVVDPHEIYAERLNPSIKKCFQNNWCTRQYTKKNFYAQHYYFCITCDITEDKGMGVCQSCIKICHKGHNIVEKPAISYAFFCDCAVELKCTCFEEGKDYSSNFDNLVEPSTKYHDLVPIELRKTNNRNHEN
eukprot:TRINITY_DN1854_c0_g1_i1.p1 TRINITY_DN1854_c0_g1~~TRINITY_DN1854_c0_g1_i1.p1  ORF type:complete len:419 (-),score=102.74 TRINITY_DN1854_c0_g1_i1:78-1334(-)